MQAMAVAGVLFGFFLAISACGKAGSQSPIDGAGKSDSLASSTGGAGSSGGIAAGGAAGGVGGSADGGTSRTAGTTGIHGTGGVGDLCAGKAPNCHVFPYGCHGTECQDCPCEGGQGGAPGRGGIAGGYSSGGVSGAGGRGGLDANEVDSCFDPLMKSCSTVTDCRLETEVNCCGTDEVLGMASVNNCHFSIPDCSYRACMKWPYLSAEDGNTTESGGTIALRCLSGQCSTWVILPAGVDGGRRDGPTDKPATGSP
jgi:hypothetical protein